MATTVQSRKAKGRRLQQLVRDQFLKAYEQLTNDDVRSTSMGAGGVDITLSAFAKTLIPFDVECKAQEGFGKLYDAYEQAGENTVADRVPLVVIKSNNKEPLAVVHLDALIRLMKGLK